MDAKQNLRDIELALDVGHGSIGWSVLQSPVSPQSPTINLLGCGVVTVGADDCLASKRRGYRRQRRHARSTRQRIGRMGTLLAHMKILTPAQLAAKHQQAGMATGLTSFRQGSARQMVSGLFNVAPLPFAVMPKAAPISPWVSGS